MTSEAQLLNVLAVLRRHRQRRLVLESAVRVTLAALVAVIVGLAIMALWGPGTATVVSIRLIGYLLIGAAAVRFALLPLLRKASDERMALYVEEGAPELRQSLLAAVHELGQPRDRRASAALTELVVKRALGGVRPLAEGAMLERPRALRAARTLAAAVAVAAIALTFGPAALRDTARVLFVPWSTAAAAVTVFAIDLDPGDATVPRGGAVDVRARLVAFTAAGAELVFRGDSAADWIRLPMVPDSGGGAFTSRLYDLTRPTEYYVEAENVRSRVYRLAVSDLPTARRIALELRYPAYTGLAPERIEDGGDVAAVVGTTVVTRITASKRVRGGALHFDGGASVALTSASDSLLTGSFRVSTNGFYRVDLVADDGRSVPGTVQYAVEALADRPPAVSFREPGRDVKVTSVEELTLGARAADDYGVLKLEIRYTVNGGDEQRVVLADGAAPGARDLPAAHTLFLEEMGLKPGDVIAYHGAARDGAGQWGLSDVYFLEVRPFSRTYRQADQGGGGGGGGESPDGFVVRQRQIVAATFNSLRDSAATEERRRREDLTTIAIAQGRLRQDVTALVRRLGERGVAAADSSFHGIKGALDSAAAVMQPAEEFLGRKLARAALPPEQRALQYLQRAEALYREVQVQLGGDQQGGGGGGQQNAEDLADLFELETDKLRNQYESVRRESERSAERELDETLERLRQLASRQQQENERMQRMSQELRERLGRSSAGGGGGGSAQRELARQAEEEARRLERLSRERNEPQLAEAARRLQETAEAMRRAASGQSAQGSAALEELRRATRDLEGARATRLTEEIRGLENRARAMRERQREITADVAGLPNATPEARAEQLQRLTERKDALAADVERLEADADRLSRGARRDQPGAAAALGEAAEDIRVSRLRDKVVFSKNVMRGGSAEYADAFEGQIAQDLERVAGRLGAAAGALTGEPAGRRRDRALESARELVRGLESLRDRIAGRSGPGQERDPAGAPGDSTGAGQQPGQGRDGQASGQQGQQPNRVGPGDARQFGREFRMRRESAQELRRELGPEGVDMADLDRAIEDLRRLESGRPFGDPLGLDRLQAEAIERLKTFEFGLYRRLGLGNEHRPTAGTPAQVPPEYRALVEEYYRSLGQRERTP